MGSINRAGKLALMCCEVWTSSFLRRLLWAGFGFLNARLTLCEGRLNRIIRAHTKLTFVRKFCCVHRYIQNSYKRTYAGYITKCHGCAVKIDIIFVSICCQKHILFFTNIFYFWIHPVPCIASRTFVSRLQGSFLFNTSARPGILLLYAKITYPKQIIFTMTYPTNNKNIGAFVLIFWQGNDSIRGNSERAKTKMRIHWKYQWQWLFSKYLDHVNVMFCLSIIWHLARANVIEDYQTQMESSIIFRYFVIQ